MRVEVGNSIPIITNREVTIELSDGSKLRFMEEENYLKMLSIEGAIFVQPEVANVINIFTKSLFRRHLMNDGEHEHKMGFLTTAEDNEYLVDIWQCVECPHTEVRDRRPKLAAITEDGEVPIKTTKEE